MLQGEIKRDFQHNYLVFPTQRERMDYQMQMLVHQKISGVLPCMIRRVDGRQLFSYDISGKVPMKQVFEGKGLDYGELEKLLQTLGKIVEAMKDYLLDMELLVLLPEYIFYEESTKQWFFVCFPREEENIYNAFHELSKYFLTVLNHKEEKAVQMGYALYRSTMSENFRLGQVLSQVQEETAEQAIEKNSNKQEILYGAMDETIDQGNKDKGENRENREIRETRATNVTLVQDGNTPSYGEIKEKKKRFSFNGSSDKQRRKSVSRRNEKKEKKKKFIYGETPKLASYAAEGSFTYGNCQCILKGITKPKTTLQVQNFPYLVGSLEYAVDGYVDSSEVSHFHARMQKEGDEYYITDLVSESGTYVNGQRVASEIPQKLADGDRISFGNAEFAFVCK